jgi:hypothetical protein
MVILEVEWVDGGSVYYSDQEVDGCQPKILRMDGFDTSMILEGSGDSQELSIVLDDTDESIRNIYDNYDIHKRPARVYMLHKGLDLEFDKILVFKGELVTPIEWSESLRSVSFNILSKLNSQQVGFSMEEGDFPNIPEEALGKAWPLVFGQVCHLPAVKVRAPRRGYLQASQSTGNQGVFTKQGSTANYTYEVQKTVGPELECVNRRFGEICRLRDLLSQQTAYEYDEMTIYNGTSFPQNESVTIYVDGAEFQGSFSGNDFTVTSRKHPEWDTFNHQECVNVPAMAYGTVAGRMQFGGSTNTAQGAGGYFTTNTTAAADTRVWRIQGTGTYFTPNQTQGQAYASCDAALVSTPAMIGGPKDSWALYDSMEESSFFWAPAGTEVYVEGEQEILYIASLIPGTVDGVAAYRTAPNGFRYLTEVPSDRYTVYQTDYDGYEVVEIGMTKALSQYVDDVTKDSEGWDDQIYVSFTSDVGPNACDIIQWLIEKYTDLTVDSTTFASVKSYLTNYPNNFYLTEERPDVYELIRDIAYQSRCAVYVRNDVVYIKYLSLEPTAERTIDESDILSGTFSEHLSETENVYTTHNINWRTGGAAVRADQEVLRKIILKYNVKKYGTVEEEWNYYTYNLYDLVLKSSTFWLIRKSTSWKRVTFATSLKHMDLDVGDCVTLDVEQFGAPVKVIIETMNLEPDSNTVAFGCWTPIRSGENEAYYWAWPSQQSTAAIWPLSGDADGGAGYDFDVTPPLNHILLGGAHRDDQIIITTGDLHPSDLDDTLPTVRCELSDNIDFDEKPPEIIAKEIAQSTARTQIENGITGGGNPGGGSIELYEEDECGDFQGDGCIYLVKVQWHTSTRQGQATSQGGPALPGETEPCGGPCHCLGGCPSCTGPIWEVCHTYGSPWGARMAREHWQQEYGKSSQGYWKCSETGALRVKAENGEHQGAFADDCEDVADALDPGDVAAGGETAQPTGLTGDEPIPPPS